MLFVDIRHPMPWRKESLDCGLQALARDRGAEDGKHCKPAASARMQPGPMVKYRAARARAREIPHTRSSMSDLSQFEMRAAGIQQAVDAINHAFVVYDADERFRFCNRKHRDWYAPIEQLLT